MTRRGKVSFRLAAAAFAALAGLGSCREHGTPDPNINLAISHEREDVGAGSSSPTGSEPGRVAVPTKLEVPPGVAEAFSGIRVSWKNASSGKAGTLDVPLGGSATIPDSTVSVRADVYLPAFTMTAEVITSSSVKEENPAARISVSDQGKEIFAGWVFSRFPDVHPFQHPRFSLRLEGGIRKAT
jgi:Uncharacterized protein conserved in bacteria (DUF2155)